MTSLVCGPLKLDVAMNSIPGMVLYSITPTIYGKLVGYMSAILSDGVLEMSLVRVSKPHCGIGTKLYERAYQIACEQNAIFMSGNERSDASEGFWRKQVKKGRARCVRMEPPAKRLRDEPGKGLVETRQVWDCGQYAMRKVCPRKMDLSDCR